MKVQPKIRDYMRLAKWVSRGYILAPWFRKMILEPYQKQQAW
jgi:hypothetical protein